MSIYLYGIVQPQAGTLPVEALVGSEGVCGPVSIEEHGECLLVFGAHDGQEILPRRKALLAHARVLETAMGAGTVLPMRFGMTCGSLQEFHSIARHSARKIDEAFDRLRGRVEIGVRVEAPEEAALEAALSASPALSRERDLLARRGKEAHFAKVGFGRALGDAVAARRRDAQKSLMARLVPLCVDYVLKAPETDFEPLRAELLVDEVRLPDVTEWLEKEVASLDFAAPSPCDARIVGPGPGFHFANVSLDPDTVIEVA